jgi:hypothetical protein
VLMKPGVLRPYSNGRIVAEASADCFRRIAEGQAPKDYERPSLAFAMDGG